MTCLHTIKINTYTFLLTCTLFGCYSIKESNNSSSPIIQGVYYKDGLKNFILNFQKDTFSYFERRYGGAIYTCCDTLTKGTFQIDYSNKLVYLSTSDYLNDLVLKANVEEKNSSVLDSIFITITNPIESAYLGDSKDKINRLFYRIKLEGSDFLFLSKISGQIYNDPKIIIYVPKDIKLESFSLEIYPNYNSLQLRSYNVQYIRTLRYNINNHESRIFNLEIPGLDFSYLSYLRLSKDIVKIIDTKKLEWDGHYFFKKEN